MMDLRKTQSMFFRSLRVDAHWDTWMCLHEGTFYLYYLITESSPGEGFGAAVSPDGVTWTDRGWALRASEKMEIFLGTGAVWKTADFETSGRFICNYSEYRREGGEKPQQRILFAWSRDLLEWTKYGDERSFCVNEDFYRKPGRWDCIFAIPSEGGGFCGYWTANPLDHVGFGFGRSSDGLHWKALRPPRLEWDGEEAPQRMEIGAVELIDGRYYALTGQPDLAMRTMIAERLEGPYRVASKNYRLMENTGDHKHTYFARFLRTPDGLLVNHHAIPRFKNEHDRPRCCSAPLKKAYVDGEGTLWLTYWPGNDALKRTPVDLKLAGGSEGLGAADTGVSLVQWELPVEGGLVLEGKIELPGDATKPQAHPGFFIETGKDEGSYIAFGPGGVTEFGLMKHAAGRPKRVREDLMKREWSFGSEPRFRLLLKQSVLELYLEDIYIQSYSLLGEATGRIGLLGNPRSMRELKAWKAT